MEAYQLLARKAFMNFKAADHLTYMTLPLLKDTRLILSRKISSTLINEKIQRYVNEFVLCSECKKPDTQLRKDNKVTTMKCMACGAKHPVRSKI